MILLVFSNQPSVSVASRSKSWFWYCLANDNSVFSRGGQRLVQMHYTRESQVSKKPGSQIKIVIARGVTWNPRLTEGPQILGVTAQNFFSWAPGRPRFVHPCNALCVHRSLKRRWPVEMLHYFLSCLCEFRPTYTISVNVSSSSY
jgi:hypothetical protein